MCVKKLDIYSKWVYPYVMQLKIQKPKIYDHTDGDVIMINKSSLINAFELVRSYAHSSAGWISALAFSVNFFLVAFVSESFKSFGPVTGENIRSVIIVLGVLTLMFSIYRFTAWFRLKEKYDPDALVKNLTDGEAQDLYIPTEKSIKETTIKALPKKIK